jgi:hypothetical protein
MAARLAPLTPERAFVDPDGQPTFTVYRSDRAL